MKKVIVTTPSNRRFTLNLLEAADVVPGTGGAAGSSGVTTVYGGTWDSVTTYTLTSLINTAKEAFRFVLPDGFAEQVIIHTIAIGSAAAWPSRMGNGMQFSNVYNDGGIAAVTSPIIGGSLVSLSIDGAESIPRSTMTFNVTGNAADTSTRWVLVVFRKRL